MLALNLAFMTFVFAVAAKIYIMPRLGGTARNAILTPILLLHATRNLGMMFLSPGATYSGISTTFAYPAALGDLLAAILALAALASVARLPRYARPLVWLFNVVGTVDLLLAITLATAFGVEKQMGPAYWIPAVWVPALLVTHYIVFVVLLRHWGHTSIRSMAS